MHFMDPHFFLSASAFNLYISISCDWKIKLGNLIVLRIIRIKIVLAVKFTYLRDLTVCCKSDRHRIFYNLLIQYRKRPRHTGADRAGMRIRCPTKFGTASTENLCLCCQFDMNFQSDHCLILLCHDYCTSFSAVRPICAGTSCTFFVAHS